jgi:hypothetical protein
MRVKKMPAKEGTEAVENESKRVRDKPNQILFRKRIGNSFEYTFKGTPVGWPPRDDVETVQVCTIGKEANQAPK